jgi:Xaa-Pro aminopeptidase
VLAATPGDAAVVEQGASVVLELRTAPGGANERVSTQWTIDGSPVASGEQLRLTADRVGTLRARALATGSLGAAVAREWEVTVRPPVVVIATATTAVPTTMRPIATTVTTTSTLAVAVARVPPTTQPPRPTRAELRPDDVDAFLDRYRAAWRARDIDELRRVGQVASEAQEAALRQYFAKDPEVEIRVEDVQIEGERATVRFVRRDRFRDDAGRLVTQDSPAISKDVVRGPGGLRFAPRRE